MIIIFIGLPGSGKGTQSKLLLDKTPAHYISVGDLLRSYSKGNDLIAKKINDSISTGSLIEDDIVNNIVCSSISKSKKDIILIDGYPRKLSQANFLENNLAQEEKIKYIHFSLDDNLLKDRILNRVICKSCGNIFSKINNSSMVCNVCGSNDVIFRKDDTIEVLNKRIKSFKEDTLPMINAKKGGTNFLDVNADDSLENISKIIFNFIKTD